MLTALDRLTIYSVMCFISFCSLVMMKTSVEHSLMPLIGVIASIGGIWLEMHLWKGSSEEQKH